MLLSATLFASLLGVSIAHIPGPDFDGQCPLITKTYTGAGVWMPTANIVTSPRWKSTGSVGSWTEVLGHSGTLSGGAASPSPGSALLNSLPQGWDSVGAGSTGPGRLLFTGASYKAPSTSQQNQPGWEDWHSAPTSPKSMGTTPVYGISGPPTGASARPTPISPVAANTVSPGEPFVIYIIAGRENGYPKIVFVEFINNVATVCASQANATVLILNNDGQLTTYAEQLVVGVSRISGSSTLSLYQNQSSVATTWSFGADGLQYMDATFCLSGDNSQNVDIVFDQAPAGCMPVQLAGDKQCSACTSTTSSTINSRSTSVATTSNSAPISNSTSTDFSTSVSISVSTAVSTTAGISINTSTNTTTGSAGSTGGVSTSSTNPGSSHSVISSSATSSTSTAAATSLPFVTNTTTDANGTTVAITGPIDFGSAPRAQLSFVFPPDIDMGSLDRFVPQIGSNLWFSGENAGGPGANGAVTVRVSVNYTYPSIVLDHSVYIMDVSCTNSSIQGSINNTEAFVKAQAQWIQNSTIFITSTPSCITDGGSAFFLVSSNVKFDPSSDSFTISGSAAQLADIYQDLGVDFGNIDYSTPNSTSNSSTCASPSSSTIQGLPAAGCGTNFDQTLDDALGYYSASGDEAYVLSQAAPAVGSISNITRRAIGMDLHEPHHLYRRHWWSKVTHAISSAVKTVTHAVSSAVSTAVTHVIAAVKSDISTVIHTVAHLAVAAIKATIHLAIAVVKTTIALAKLIVTGNYSNSFHLPIKIGPSEAVLVDSPWGEAFKILTWTPDKGLETFKVAKTALDKITSTLIGEPDPEPGVEVFCVNCGIAGQFILTGKLSATPLSGLKAASVGMAGTLTAGLFLGVNAFAEYKKEYEIDLFTQGLPGWEIPKIIQFGPILTLGVSAELDITAEGQLLVGGSATWPSIATYLDFVDHSKSYSSGWRPNIDHKFDVTGTLSAEASLGLPVSIELGIVVLEKYGRTIALTDRPAIAVDATLSADYNVTTGVSVGDDECPGIEWDIGFENTVTLGFKKITSEDGKEAEIEDGPKFTLDDWKAPPLAKGCIKLGIGGGDGSDSGDTNANGTCSYYNGENQWVDPRSNSWNIYCNVSASTLTNRNLINKFNSSSMIACFETCYYGNGCEQAVWLADTQQCGWLVTATCLPTDATCAASGTMISTCTASTGGADCPSKMAQTFDAVSVPISPFLIYSASYKNVDITADVQTWWNRGHWITTYHPELLYLFPQIGDPAPGDLKPYYMFYSYNGEYRSFASVEGNSYDIQAGPIQFPQAQRVTSDPETSRLEALANGASAAQWLRIYDFNFGLTPLPAGDLDTIRQYWYQAVSSGESQIEIDLADFNNDDSDFGFNKAGAIYFSSFVQNPGIIGYAVANEGQFIQRTTFSPPPGYKKRSLDAHYVWNLMGRQDNSSTALYSNSTSATAQNTTSNSTVDVNLALLTDITGELTLQLGIDGNLWLSTSDVDSDDIGNLTTGELLIGVQQPSEQIMGDSTGNLLHYFPNELTVTGASRLRLASWDKLPITSQLVSLVNMNGTLAGDQMIVAVDTQGNYAWLWVCTYADQLNKVFLTNSATDSNSTLMSSTAQFTVVGGTPTACNPLALVPTWDDPNSN